MFVCTKIVLRIGPVLPPPGPYQHDRAFGNAPVFSFPCGDVVGTDQVIAISIARGGDINNHRRSDQPSNRYFIGTLLPLGKMQRTVDMGATMFARSITSRGIEISTRCWPPLI